MKEYVQPDVQVEKFEVEDILTTSSGNETPGAPIDL